MRRTGSRLHESRQTVQRAAPPPQLVQRRAGGVVFRVKDADRGTPLLMQRPRVLPFELRQMEWFWVLVGQNRTVYMPIGPDDHALWGLIDGTSTVAEIAEAHRLREGKADVQRVTEFMQSLQRASLVELLP